MRCCHTSLRIMDNYSGFQYIISFEAGDAAVMGWFCSGEKSVELCGEHSPLTFDDCQIQPAKVFSLTQYRAHQSDSNYTPPQPIWEFQVYLLILDLIPILD